MQADSVERKHTEPVTPAGTSDEPAQAGTSLEPEAVSDEPYPLVVEAPRDFIPPTEHLGQPLAKVNPDKYVPVLVLYDPREMAKHVRLGALFPRAGQRDEDGEPFILNEDMFRVDELTGYILHGDAVVGVRRKEVHQKLMEWMKQQAQEPLRYITTMTERDIGRSAPGVPVEGTLTMRKD